MQGDTYTKEEVNQKIADAITNGKVDLSGYATVDDLLGLEDSLSDVAFSGDYNDLSNTPDMTVYATQNQVSTTVQNALNNYEIPDGSVTSAKLNTGDLPAGLAMLVSDGNGSGEWVTVDVLGAEDVK